MVVAVQAAEFRRRRNRLAQRTQLVDQAHRLCIRCTPHAATGSSLHGLLGQTTASGHDVQEVPVGEIHPRRQRCRHLRVQRTIQAQRPRKLGGTDTVGVDPEAIQ